jgi:hypothetical protein
MPQDIRTLKQKRAALCAAVGAILMISGSVGTALAGDDDNDLLPDQKFVRGLMRGLGLRNGNEDQIEYKERPPLVVPPSRDLPAPVTTGSLSERNPAWPVDPDEKQRKTERKLKSEHKPVDWIAAGDPLKPSELAAGRTNAPSSEKGNPSVETSAEMKPSELGYTGGLWADFKSFGTSFSKEKVPETKNFLREPSRASLTDPPAGYRTPSPDQPYGVNASKEKAKAQTLEERQSEGAMTR